MTYVDTSQRDEYTATSGQTVFAYTFRILANTHIKVYQEGSLLTITTHYTVSGVGDAGGGNVTLVTGATLDDTIILIRDTPDDQNTDYTASGIFPAESHETALDKLTMRGQDLNEKLIRSLKFAITSLLNDIAAPEGTSASDRGGKVWAWNSAGTALELVAATSVDAVSVIAVKGDIVQGDASGDAEKLAIGADGTILHVSTDLLAYDKPWSLCWKKGADIASANALTLGDDGNYFDITGTTAITSIVATDIGKVFRLHFDGALTLTHHSTNLVIPSAANITTIAGDEAVFVAYDTGDVRLIGYYSSQPTIADLTKMNHTHASAAQGGTITGRTVQVVNIQSSAMGAELGTTGTTAIPADDTIPQWSTEGDLYLSRAITPTDASNNLKIDISLSWAQTNTSAFTIALFQDTTADALAVAVVKNTAANVSHHTSFTHFMAAGTTSATTFKVKAGGVTGATTTINGFSGARKGGGVLYSSITITEIQA